MQIDFTKLEIPKDEEDVFLHKIPALLYYMDSDDNVKIMELLLNLPAPNEMVCPIIVQNIQCHQNIDHTLVATQLQHFYNYHIKTINTTNLIYHIKNLDQPNNWKIYISLTLMNNVIRWYHVVLGNHRYTRLYNTIRVKFHVERLSVLCKEYRCLENCTEFKLPGKGYRELPLDYQK